MNPNAEKKNGFNKWVPFGLPRRFSESSAHAVDRAVRELLLEAEQGAVTVIHDHRPQLDKLVVALEEQEALEREQIEACLGPSKQVIKSGAASA